MQPRPDEPIFTVSELNREARELLEGALPALWVEGEISNFIHHGSGHMYFDLKDEGAQVRCAMFRGANRRLQFRPENGLQVLLQGRVTLYEPRGSYQLVAEAMEPAGEGLLRRRLEALKSKLQTEGLFAAEHKQALPSLPRRIGVITSPTSAAVRDILKVLRRRFPAIPVIIYPTQVQGERAAGEISAALVTAARRAECDVLICGRGGGSLEDLWSFNEEQVVRAIFASPIPVISAVGHETDITLADLVADMRAPTPSAAAELAVPDAQGWQQQFTAMERRSSSAMQRQLSTLVQGTAQLTGRLRRRSPRFILRQNAQRLDELASRARRASAARLESESAHLLQLSTRLLNASPNRQCQAGQQKLREQQLRLSAAMQTRLTAARGRLATLAAGLQIASPLATLDRGYALVTDGKTGATLRDAADLKTGQEVEARLARGGFRATITRVLKPKP
ncbi:MAG: exodeoxyribonuclease VII large subunit [Gammaproteobacteria bacterium]